jgi:hypothetical protein
MRFMTHVSLSARFINSHIRRRNARAEMTQVFDFGSQLCGAPKRPYVDVFAVNRQAIPVLASPYHSMTMR